MVSPTVAKPIASELTRLFLFSAIDHACNDAKIPIHAVNSRFEEWKTGRMDDTGEDQKAEEEYILHYSNKRAEYEEAYIQWQLLREDVIKKIKATDVIGEQERLMKELSSIEFPEALYNPVPDIYTRYISTKIIIE